MIKLLRPFLLLLLVSGLGFFPLHVFAAGNDGSEIKVLDMRLSPKDTLFNIANMKPGDWATRTITVENNGVRDFDYHMQLRNTGEKKLFNELVIEVKVDNQELYQGKLSEFQSKLTRKLKSASDDQLAITIRFPEHLGNDFQGLESSFVLTFIAEGKDSKIVEDGAQGIIGSSGSSAGFRLPATSTNLFNLLLLGSVLSISGFVLLLINFYKRMKLAQ
ncbi:hypothetical protein QT711_07960 [Sporosarcina saromensis]|uniref:LPXTG-motif cell wall anchor domain-containing protein n=1 Tax=Sporosarcina saromensis TaxID=359365 RepID=A0ABU4G814_9BACL|nr:hypothetical protein [Sporosarcina saromensis]MDW0113118.1 hypothetical protein [Sporosarcina saromensis]